MGAFLKGYMAQQQADNQQSAADLQRVHGAMGLMELMQGQQEQAQVKSILANSPDPATAIPALMKAGKLGIQTATGLASLQKQQAEAEATKRKTDFYSPANQAQFMAPGQTLPPATPNDDDGNPNPGVQMPGQLDVNRFLQAGVSQGHVNGEVWANHVAQQEQKKLEFQSARETRAANLEARIYEVDKRSEDKALDRESRAALQSQALEMRKQLAQLVANLRQPPNAQVVQTAQGPMTLGPDRVAMPILGADGKPVKSPASSKPQTEFQGKATMFGTRTADSDKVLTSIEDEIFKPGLMVGQSMGVVGNAFMSANQQRVDQAQRNFVNATLRQESGATIQEHEFQNAKKQYFPQPGDSKAVIEQKRRNRQLVISGFKRMAGPDGANDIQAVLDTPLPADPSAPAAAPVAGPGWSIKPKAP